MWRLAKIAAFGVFITCASAWLMLTGAKAVIGSQRAVIFGGTVQVVAPPLTPCVSTGIYNLANVCNDIYFIGALK